MTKDEILAGVAGYPADATSVRAERQFERDKTLLREQGIPLSTRSESDDARQVRYYIDASSWENHEFSPTGLQAALLALTLAQLAPPTKTETSGALNKLLALSPRGVLETEAELSTSLDIGVPEYSFDALTTAISDMRSVEFSYLPAYGKRATRHVQPWLLRWEVESWYLLGFDTDRNAPRWFRLSRIIGEVRMSDTSGEYAIPVDVAEYPAPQIHGEGSPCAVELAIEPDAAWQLRDGATHLGTLKGRDIIGFETRNLARLAEQVASSGGDVIPLDPPELVDAVCQLWQKAAGYAG
ncbi:MAG: WYL domain-containing protein [Bowdeniella nasicola]|nr:WYL domain-containing protein [Bowdeniella nasicola]